MNPDFSTESNIKKRIIANVNAAVKEYETLPECSTRFGTPIISYVSVHHPLFMHFFESGRSLHPKQIYRPGNTAIVFFLPYDEKVAKSNLGGEMPSKEWTNAYFDSMKLCMTLNRIISDTLDEVGRLHSPANIPTDWQEEVFREEWSQKLAGFAAGLGRFGIAGSFHTEVGFAGRLSTVLVDADYAILDEDEIATLDLENVLPYIDSDSKYLGAEDVRVSQNAIDSCPANAISSIGIDKAKCQQHCKKINKVTPSPEVCGKCFPFDL